jgi:hypothetical protein
MKLLDYFYLLYSFPGPGGGEEQRTACTGFNQSVVHRQPFQCYRQSYGAPVFLYSSSFCCIPLCPSKLQLLTEES